MSRSHNLRRPPYDASLCAVLGGTTDKAVSSTGNLEDMDSVKACRKEMQYGSDQSKHALEANPSISVQERLVPGPRGDIPIVILRPVSKPDGTDDQSGKMPGIVFYHGGAMVAGNAYSGLTDFSVFTEALGSTIVSVDYRLAPEHPGLALVEDCYAALLWVGENLESLNIDPDKLLIAGGSAGGGMAAATALMARDKGGPKLCGQLLICPMLDDRNSTVSCRQFSDGIIYNTTINRFAWRHVLGDEAGGKGVSYYVAPSRATDLSGLPPTFIDVGSADCFRDEDVAYAQKLWEGGVDAELHVWPGGCHGYQVMAPGIPISKGSMKARDAWVYRAFGIDVAPLYQ